MSPKPAELVYAKPIDDDSVEYVELPDSDYEDSDSSDDEDELDEISCSECLLACIGISLCMSFCIVINWMVHAACHKMHNHMHGN